MNNIGALLSLTRPVNAAICGLSVIAGGSLGGRPLDRLGEIGIVIITRGFWNLSSWQWRTILASISAAFILAAGNVFNDVRDVATDRINVPGRPIPSGRVSIGSATVFAALLAISGICLAMLLGNNAIAVAIAASTILVWYDIQLKGIPLAGNAAVALLGGLAFIYGGIAGYGITYACIPALFAFLFHLGRELIKDGADYEGDQKTGIRTVATVYGIQTTTVIASGVLALLAVITVIPVVTGLFGLGYLAIITVLVLPVLVWSAISAIRRPTPENLRHIATLLKADMPAGIVALLVGFQF